MNLRVYERFMTSLPLEEKDRYCVEASAIEGHLRIPTGLLPRASLSPAVHGHDARRRGDQGHRRRESPRARDRLSSGARASPRRPSGSSPNHPRPAAADDPGRLWLPLEPRDEACSAVDGARSHAPAADVSVLRHWPAARAASRRPADPPVRPRCRRPHHRTARRTERKGPHRRERAERLLYRLYGDDCSGMWPIGPCPIIWADPGRPPGIRPGGRTLQSPGLPPRHDEGERDLMVCGLGMPMVTLSSLSTKT